MSESRLKRPPTLPNKLSLPFMTGSVMVFLVLLALPVSQMVSGTPEPPPTDLDTNTLESPPDIPPEVIEPEEPEDPDIDKLKDVRERPPLSAIEVMNNPNLKGIDSGIYTVAYKDIGNDIMGGEFCPWDQLTRAPQAIKQQQPIYPGDLKSAGIEGEVVLTFLVLVDGTTQKIKVVRSTNPGFEKAAIRSVRKWVFEPGEKDGKVVSTNVRISIPFRIRGNL